MPALLCKATTAYGTGMCALQHLACGNSTRVVASMYAPQQPNHTALRFREKRWYNDMVGSGTYVFRLGGDSECCCCLSCCSKPPLCHPAVLRPLSCVVALVVFQGRCSPRAAHCVPTRNATVPCHRHAVRGRHPGRQPGPHAQPLMRTQLLLAHAPVRCSY